MITKLHTCAVKHELDLRNILVIQESTQQRVYTRAIDITFAVGFWLEQDIYRYFILINSTTMLSRYELLTYQFSSPILYYWFSYFTVDFSLFYYIDLSMTFNVIDNVNNMGSHRVRTFNIPRLCSSLAWWWPTAAETSCLLFNIFVIWWLILSCFRL